MIDSIEFRNFKVLRHAKLTLGPFTLIVGPNGSGKSTVLKAFEAIQGEKCYSHAEAVSLGIRGKSESLLDAHIRMIESGVDRNGDPYRHAHEVVWLRNAKLGEQASALDCKGEVLVPARGYRGPRVGVFALEANAISEPHTLTATAELESDGRNLSSVLSAMRDHDPASFDALNAELARWMPEFRRVAFDIPADGKLAIWLETSLEKGKIRASDLSQGTLLSLALLALAHNPRPPSLIALEEPDRGIHPRLLREIKDALYRLAFPESFDMKRPPVQVIATTHSPYFLDLFSDHPDEIVIANKSPTGATFTRLSEHPHIDEILDGSHLGAVWYSGILGGVPSAP